MIITRGEVDKYLEGLRMEVRETLAQYINQIEDAMFSFATENEQLRLQVMNVSETGEEAERMVKAIIETFDGEVVSE